MIALAVDLDLAGGDVGGALGIFRRQLRRGAGVQPPVDVEHRRVGLHLGLGAERLAGDQPRPQAAALVGRQVRRRRGGRRPGRSPPAPSAARPRPGCRACGPPCAAGASKRSEWVMPRPAVIQFTSPGRIACSEPTLSRWRDLALEQIGDGGEADVRMRPHVDAARDAGREVHRPHVVEEHERADHAPLRAGSTRPTSNPPRSRRRWSMTSSGMLVPSGRHD